ncbi:MAG: hypothetical protein KAX49_10810 [Halanaerobiales bacterium]|nr:hypothetical protein [Halanaerobiales bacterium]
MRLKVSNLFENLLVRILFSTFYIIIIFPLLKFFFELCIETKLTEGLIWFFGAAIFLGSCIMSMKEKISHRILAKVTIFLFFIGVSLLLTYFMRISPVFNANLILNSFQMGFIMILGCLLFGNRYERLVVKEVYFMRDFSIGIFILLLQIALKDLISISITVPQILIFFIVGSALGIYLKYADIKGGTGEQRLWLVVMISVVGFISVAASFFTFGISLDTLNNLITPLIWVADIVRKLFFKILLYIVMVLGPVLELVINFLRGLLKPSDEGLTGQNMIEGAREGLSDLSTSYLPPNLNWLFRIIIFAIVFLILIYVIKKFNSSRNQETGYEEIRESIYDPTDLKNDFLNFIQSITNKFRKDKSIEVSIYDGSSYVLKIREIYYLFLKEFHQKIPFRKNYSPEEYRKEVVENSNDYQEELRTLTKVYEIARYSTKGDEESFIKIEEAYKQISDLHRLR